MGVLKQTKGVEVLGSFWLAKSDEPRRSVTFKNTKKEVKKVATPKRSAKLNKAASKTPSKKPTASLVKKAKKKTAATPKKAKKSKLVKAKPVKAFKSKKAKPVKPKVKSSAKRWARRCDSEAFACRHSFPFPIFFKYFSPFFSLDPHLQPFANPSLTRIQVWNNSFFPN
jgi:hypothetical protein